MMPQQAYRILWPRLPIPDLQMPPRILHDVLDEKRDEIPAHLDPHRGDDLKRCEMVVWFAQTREDRHWGLAMWLIGFD